MKRSLIMLLVLAMLATIIPSFALADVNEFKINASATSYTAVLDATGYDWPAITVTAVTDDSWSVSYTLPRDQKIIQFDDEDNPYNYEVDDIDSDGFSFVPYFRVLAEGKTKLTATGYDYYGNSSSIEIPIEVKKAPATETIAFDKTQITVADLELTVGNSRSYWTFVYVTKPTERTYYGRNFLWSVSDSKVAKVDKDGRVTALAEGTVTLTAMAIDNPNAKDSIEIKVKAAKEEEKPEEKGPKLSFSTTEFTLEKGKGDDLEQYLKVVDPVAGDSIIWTTSDRGTVSVEEDTGWIYGKEIGGPVTITARSKKFPTASATCTVTVVKAKEQLEDISFSAVPKTVRLGEDLNVDPFINIKPTASRGTFISQLAWTSTDPQVAYVDVNRNLYARGIGKATISAVYREDTTKSASFEIEVVPVPITKVNFAKSEYTLVVGRSYTLNDFENEDYTFEPSNYTKRHYTETFTSDNDDVVGVSDYGNLYARKVGEAKVTLTVRNEDGSVVVSDPITVKVTDKTPTAVGFKQDKYTIKLSSKNSEKDLTLKLTPADAFVEDDDLYVVSSNPSVADAYVSGTSVTVTAYKKGETTMTVKSHSNPALTGSTTVTVEPIQLESVALEKKLDLSYYTDAKGNIINSDKEIKAVITPSDAFFEATWETSDPSVLLVKGNEGSRYAEITPVGAGKATVTVPVTDGTNTKKATMTVTVKAGKITKLALSTTKANVYIIKGEANTLQLTATDTKTDEVVPVTWKTSNKKIATVSKKGLVTFKKAGKVVITATSKDGNATTAKCTLNIKKLKVTKVSAQKTLSLMVGEAATLNVTVKPAKAYNPAVAFKSSNKKVATVDEKGYITAVNPGKAVITVTAKDGSKKSAKITVTVTGTSNNGDLAVEGEQPGAESVELDAIEGLDNDILGDMAIEIVDGAAGIVIE